MATSRMPEVLYDSETMLRLVDNEIAELRDDPQPEQAGGLLVVLQQASSEITRVLSTLRDSRQALQQASVHQLRAGSGKLREVTSATEVAATTILDGLDRAQGLVDRLDELDTAEEHSRAHEAAAVRTALRDELFGMMASLQFQDITTQQIEHVSAIMSDVEHQLVAVASMLDGSRMDAVRRHDASGDETGHEPTFAEAASIHTAAERQAEADALFGRDRARTSH